MEDITERNQSSSSFLNLILSYFKYTFCDILSYWRQKKREFIILKWFKKSNEMVED